MWQVESDWWFQNYGTVHENLAIVTICIFRRMAGETKQVRAC